MKNFATTIIAIAVGTALVSAAAATVIHRDQVHFAVADCVHQKWLEYELRTGDMPPRQDELEWYRECMEEVTNESR